MTRKEILMLAILMAKETDDLIFLAYEIVDFFNEKEQEDEEEEEEDAGIEKKVMDALGFKNPAKQFAEAAEYIKKERENARKRVEEIMNEIGESDFDEFHIDRNRLPAGWDLAWTTRLAKQPILHAREATKKLPEKNRSPWTKEDLGKLDEMLKAGSSFAEIAINLKRSEKAVETVVQKLAAGYPVGRKADK